MRVSRVPHQILQCVTVTSLTELKKKGPHPAPQQHPSNTRGCLIA